MTVRFTLGLEATVADYAHLQAWIQREDEDLLYDPDMLTLSGPSGQRPCFYSFHGPNTPVLGEYGLEICPLCGEPGIPLGPRLLTLCRFADGTMGFSHAFFCERVHEYFGWENEYSSEDFGRYLLYRSTNSFGIRYFYSTERNTFPRHHFQG